MTEESKSQQREAQVEQDPSLMDRRDFLLSLKKWSKVVIGSALFGGAMLELGTEQEAQAGAWANRPLGGGAWANRAGGGGAWANRAGGGGAWANGVGGGGAWANRGGAWANGGSAWANRGGAWVNRF